MKRLLVGIAYTACVVVAGYTIGYRSEPVIEYRNIDYSDRQQMIDTWQVFPPELQESLVKKTLKSMPTEKLLMIAKSTAFSKLRDASPLEEAVDHEDLKKNYKLFNRIIEAIE